jgi:hypothetical protein
VEFAKRLLASPERGYRLLGFVDDEWPGMVALKMAGFEVVSDYAGLAEYLRRNVVDEVAIYLPFGSFYKHSFEVASLCEQHGITMRFNSDVFGLKTTRWRAEEFNGDQYIATYTDSSELWPRTAKRVLDIVGAGIVLLLTSPLLMIAAIAIKLTSPGLLSARADRREQAPLQDLQIPDHDSKRREDDGSIGEAQRGWGPSLQDQGRS